MGHQRLGILPKSKSWRDIVNAFSSFEENNTIISSISQSTIKNVRSKFENLYKDKGIQAAFQFLILLTYASRSSNPKECLNKYEVNLSEGSSLIDVSRELKNWVNKNKDSQEYSTLASSAAIKSISDWFHKHLNENENLFGKKNNLFDVLSKASNGGGFSDYSKIYFQSFVENYLKYFLDREASSRITNIESRNEFNEELKKYVNEISKHSFETSKITQSLAAGWYNKSVKVEVPNLEKISRFLSIAFGKMQAELLREEVK